jgi:hypothetical protein
MSIHGVKHFLRKRLVAESAFLVELESELIFIEPKEKVTEPGVVPFNDGLNPKKKFPRTPCPRCSRPVLSSSRVTFPSHFVQP